MNAEDIFSMFQDIFGGGGGGFGGGRRERGVKRGFDLETEIELTLSEILEGAERTVEYQRLEVCDTCEGSGAAPGTSPETCTACGGQGQVMQQGLGGMFRMVAACPQCRATRQVDHQEVHRLSGQWQKARGEAGGSQNSGWGS